MNGCFGSEADFAGPLNYPEGEPTAKQNIQSNGAIAKKAVSFQSPLVRSAVTAFDFIQARPDAIPLCKRLPASLLTPPIGSTNGGTPAIRTASLTFVQRYSPCLHRGQKSSR
ncbi:MAG: hypothetical protein AMJ65_18430 [Phycisphaerae bacterium SG8_4]|nr:MAG: hypothetical protein AMJ65_18430 [Phycisphaerae bacterium SG8_4]